MGFPFRAGCAASPRRARRRPLWQPLRPAIARHRACPAREDVAKSRRLPAPPGERAYHPGYYAAFVLDPDGNDIEAVFHGAAQRTAASVKLTF